MHLTKRGSTSVTITAHEGIVMTWLKHVFAIALAGAMLFMGSQKFGTDNYIFQIIA